MGTTVGKESSNKFVDIYLEIEKDLYHQEQYVSGTVHINCKKQGKFSKVIVQLSCQENVQWIGPTKALADYHFIQNRMTYRDEFVIYEFPQEVIAKGQYSFPFKFLLPESITGSFYQESHLHAQPNYIRYALKGIIVSTFDEDDFLYYTNTLNIIQKPRLGDGMVGKEKMNNPVYCDCFYSMGNINIILKCDKSVIVPGDTVKISGQVDNKKGAKKIKDARIVFTENQTSVAQGQAHTQVLNEHDLYSLDYEIEPKDKQTFEFTAKVPKQINRNTVVGNIFAHYYLIEVKSRMGCYATGPTCAIHIYVDQPKQTMQKNRKIPQPYHWDPKVYPVFEYTNIKTYEYKPDDQIKFLNRKKAQKGSSLSTLSAMKSMQQEKSQRTKDSKKSKLSKLSKKQSDKTTQPNMGRMQSAEDIRRSQNAKQQI